MSIDFDKKHRDVELEYRKCPRCGSALSLNMIILDSPSWYCTAYCGWKPKKSVLIKDVIEKLEDLCIEGGMTTYYDLIQKLIKEYEMMG